jgi:hypothetical protein
MAALQQGYLEDGGPWKIVTLQPGNAPLPAWKQALSPHLKAGASPEGLVTDVSQALDTSQGRIFILVDQFEELFQFKERGGQAEEAAAFIAAMLSTGAVDGRIYVMLTMRSEYLLQCAEYPELAEAINAGLYLVPHMTRAQMRQAIVGPVQMAGAAITVELLDRLLDEVEREQGGLPVLQHALMRIWGNRKPYEPLGLDVYQQEGGLDALLDAHADAVYTGLSDKDRIAAQALFRCIAELTPEGRAVRRARTLAQIAKETGLAPEAFATVIEAFRTEGFLSLLPGPDSPLVDMLHEAIARRWKRMAEWLRTAARQRQAISTIESATKEWIANKRDDAYLFGGRKLASIQADLDGYGFDAGSTASEFLAASRRGEALAKLRSPQSLAAFVAVVLFGIGCIWLVMSRKAEIMRLEAEVAIQATVVRAQEAEKALAALNQARAAETQTIEATLKTRAQPESGTLPRVYPQLWNAAQSTVLKAIQEKRKPTDYLVLKEETVSVGPDTSEFRYFRQAEKDTAERIARDFAKDLPLNVVYVAGYENSTRIRANHFELWFGKPQATAAPATRPVALVLYQGNLRAGAQQIADSLGADYGAGVRPYGAVSWKFESPAEVHYFHTEDRAEADSMVQMLKGAQPRIVARHMPVSQAIPNRYFEVWLQAP